MGMNKGTFKVSDAVRDVLGRTRIWQHGASLWAAALPDQLDRKLYLEVDKVLKAAGGTWDKKGRIHEFPSDPREALGLAVAEGVAVDEQKKYQAFYTPPEVARRIVNLAEIDPTHRVLEPSAGEGALVDALVERGHSKHNIQCCELNPKAVAVLRAKGYRVWHHDFLAEFPLPVPEYDRVIANFPFSGQQDIDHALRAFGVLVEGGILVGVMSPSIEFRDNAKTKRFAALSIKHKVERFDLPAGTFKESGTDVRSVIVKITKAYA